MSNSFEIFEFFHTPKFNFIIFVPSSPSTSKGIKFLIFLLSSFFRNDIIRDLDENGNMVTPPAHEEYIEMQNHCVWMWGNHMGRLTTTS